MFKENFLDTKVCQNYVSEAKIYLFSSGGWCNANTWTEELNYRISLKGVEEHFWSVEICKNTHMHTCTVYISIHSEVPSPDKERFL